RAKRALERGTANGPRCATGALVGEARRPTGFATIRVMKAAVLHGPRELRVESRAGLSPGPAEAVIRVDAAGLCGTDYSIWSGERVVSYPRVMGHELVGTVLARGADVEGVTVGQRVAVEPNYSCGECPLCREGNRNLCLSRTAVGIDVD